RIFRKIQNPEGFHLVRLKRDFAFRHLRDPGAYSGKERSRRRTTSLAEEFGLVMVAKNGATMDQLSRREPLIEVVEVGVPVGRASQRPQPDFSALKRHGVSPIVMDSSVGTDRLSDRTHELWGL